MSSEDMVAKKMAQLIRQGAVLTQYTCPVCGTPLLRLKNGKYYCAKCDREVVVVRSDEEEREVLIKYGLMDVRDALFRKAVDVAKEMSSASDIDEINRYALALVNILNALTIVSKLIGGETQGEKKG